MSRTGDGRGRAIGAALLMALPMVSMVGCSGRRGSGKAGSETRELAPFTEVASSGAFRIEVSVGSAQRVELSGDDNLLPLVLTEVEGKRLKIFSRENLNPRLALTARLTLTDLTAISSSGAGSIEVDGVDNERLNVNISGAGSVRLKGKTKRFRLDLSGAGSVRARELIAERVEVDSSGAGSVTVHASELLDVDLSGVASVRYAGDPKDVKKQVSGLGSIKKL